MKQYKAMQSIKYGREFSKSLADKLRTLSLWFHNDAKKMLVQSANMIERQSDEIDELKSLVKNLEKNTITQKIK